MDVDVRIFAGLADLLGVRRVRVSLPHRATVADLVAEIESRADAPGAIERTRVAFAVNRAYAPPSTVLADGDEVALIPPVSGGALETVPVHCRITHQPLSTDRVIARVRSPRAGAIVTFHGVTREVAHLDYEAYVEMAGPLMERLLGEVAVKCGLLAVAAEHRVGSVALGEASVVIAAAAAHRAEAFAGARAAIDRIKAEVPIWKREIDDSGRATWVPGTAV